MDDIYSLYFWLCEILEKQYGNDFDKMNKECGFEEIEEYCKLFIPPMVLDAIRDLQIQIVRNTRVKVVIEGWK